MQVYNSLQLYFIVVSGFVATESEKIVAVLKCDTVISDNCISAV